MKINKTYLPILLVLVLSVSSIQLEYKLKPLGDYSHFAESLFSNNNQQNHNDDEYFMTHKPRDKHSAYDLNVFSSEREDGDDFKIKDLMKYVITPENELDNLSSKGELSFEIMQDNKVSEMLKKKQNFASKINSPKTINIPGTLDSIKSLDLKQVVEKKSNLKAESSKNVNKTINTVSKMNVANLPPTVASLNLKLPSTANVAKELSKSKETTLPKSESKEELLNDIFTDME